MRKMIKAIIFDLDDTLFPEIEYVKSGFNAIAKEFSSPDMYNKLYSLFLKNPKNVYQRMGFDKATCEKCIQIYRNHKPVLKLSSDTIETLELLKNRGYKLGIITDGRPEGQWNKIHSLDLDNIVDNIIVTDELGSIEFRKPNPEAFKQMKENLSVEYEEMIYIGDNLSKDFIAPKLLGMKTCLYIPKDGLYINKSGSNCDFSIEHIKDLLNISLD